MIEISFETLSYVLVVCTPQRSRFEWPGSHNIDKIGLNFVKVETLSFLMGGVELMELGGISHRHRTVLTFIDARLKAKCYVNGYLATIAFAHRNVMFQQCNAQALDGGSEWRFYHIDVDMMGWTLWQCHFPRVNKSLCYITFEQSCSDSINFDVNLFFYRLMELVYIDGVRFMMWRSYVAFINSSELQENG